MPMKNEIRARPREFLVNITNEERLSACGDIQVANTARAQACQCFKSAIAAAKCSRPQRIGPWQIGTVHTPICRRGSRKHPSR